MGLAEFASWLGSQVFNVVGSFAGPQGEDDGTANVDLQVGKAVFCDVPAQMRAELWLSQLHRKLPGGGAPAAGAYYDLLFETLPAEVLDQIDKDTHRTFPGHPRVSTPEGHQSLLNVLRAYALSDPEIGYTQGMNFLAGVLLTWLPSEADAFAALSLLMNQRGLREMYLPDMSLLQIRLWQLSKLLPPRLASHLEAHAVLPVLYASSWLLTAFAADFPLHFAGRVMDALLTGHQVASPILKVAVAIVQRCEADLLRMDDFEEMVHFLRQEVPRWTRGQLQDLLSDAFSKPWSSRQLRVLDQINGAETVMEAVTRVNNLSTQSTPESAEVVAALESPGGSIRSASMGRAGSTARTAGAAAAAVAAAAVAGMDLGDEASPRGSAQLTPRTIARTLSSTGGRLPPPPGRAGKAAPAAGGKGEALVWEAFKAAEMQPITALPPQKLRIERSIGDLDIVDLDPQLSQALSCFASSTGSGRGSAPSGGSSAGPSFVFPTSSAGAGMGAAQQQQGQQGQRERGRQQEEGGAAVTPRLRAAASDAAGQARWDAFAHSPGHALMCVPSPFESGPAARAPSPVLSSAAEQGQQGSSSTPGTAPSPAAVGAAQQAGPAPAGGIDASDSRDAQMGRLHSELPLVDLQSRNGSGEQQAATPGSAGGNGGGGGAMSAFLGLFRRSVSPGGGSNASGGKAGSEVSGAASSDLQDAPSSHGSSLAVVLQQLGLAGGGSGQQQHGQAGPGGAGESQGLGLSASGRQLRHSGSDELDDGFGSFKTASQAQLSTAATGSDTSWHSPSATSQRGSGSSFGDVASGRLSAPPAAAPSPQRRSAARLSSGEAGQRAASLQEQHLAGFLTSGKEDAARQQKKTTPWRATSQ